MKGYYLVLSIFICSNLFAQQTSTNTAHINSVDTTQILELLKASKQLQWQDSYQCLAYADQALELSRQLDFKKGIALANNLKGFCFWSFGDNDLAITAAMEALEIGNAKHDAFIQAESYYILARGYMDLSENIKANESIAKAENIARQRNNWEQLCSIYNLRGVIKFIEKQKDSALFYYTKAYDLGKSHGVNPINFPRIISNIGECYEENPTIAFSYFNQALVLAKETNNKISEASITGIIGQTYLKLNDLQRAETHLQVALQLARKLGLRRVMRHAYGGMVEIKRKQGKGDEAVQYLQQYYAVRDSLLNTSKMRQIVELEAKHELQLKEQQVQLLVNEKRIQTLWKNILIALVILLLFTLLGIYYLQRYRYNKNLEVLNLEIDYLTQQHQQTVDKYKTSFTEEPQKLESHDQKLLKKAIAIVEENIADPQLGVENLALAMSMSRTNLHRKIKSITGFPPSEFIRIIRLRKAAKLILNKVDTVTQIAHQVGFDDYSHFSKVFKKHFGVSPSGYEAHTKTK